MPMLLRERIRSVPLLVQEMDLAAKRRHQEAVTLLLSRNFSGAVYLLGYEAEMLLKSAVYRRLGARPNSQAHVFFRRACKTAQDAALAGHQGQFESGHGLLYWARLVWSLQGPRGQGVPPDLRRTLFRHVWRIEARWAVEMRYSADPGSKDEVMTVLRSVEWIARHRIALWS
jgi:hypothetical protein